MSPSGVTAAGVNETDNLFFILSFFLFAIIPTIAA